MLVLMNIVEVEGYRTMGRDDVSKDGDAGEN